MNAAEEGLSTVVESLCLFGAQASLKDIKGRTAMDLALSRKHWKIYEYLKYNCLNTQ